MIIYYAIILTLYFTIGTVIALLSRRYGVVSTEDYYVAGYRLGSLLSAMTYAATTYSAFMMIGLVGFAYATGVGAFGFENLYLLATIFLLTLFAPSVWRMARERRWVSPSEMIGDLYGSRTLAFIVAVIYLLALIPYATAQMVGIGNLFQGIGFGYYTGVLFTAFIVFLWTYLAGIWSVASTDVYQGLWMIVSSIMFIIWIIFYLLPSNGLDLGRALDLVGREGYLGITSIWSRPTVFLSFTLPWTFFAVTNPQVVQRMYMPRDEKALKNMIIYFALFGLVYTILVTVIGLLARSLTIAGAFPDLTKDRDLVTPTLISLAHPIVSSIVFVSIIAASISTLDSIILTLSSTTSKDIYRSSGRVGSNKMLITYIVLAFLVLVTTAIAWFKPGFVVELSVLSSVLLLPLAPITIVAWTKPRIVNRGYIPAIVSLITGSGIGFYTAVRYGPKKAFTLEFLGLPVSLWILTVSTITLLLGLLVQEMSRRET